MQESQAREDRIKEHERKWRESFERARTGIEGWPYFMDALSVPKRFQGKSIKNFVYHDPKELNRCVDSIRNNQSVIILGGCGLGKTHLAIGLMQKWAEINLRLYERRFCWGGGNPEFIVTSDLLLKIKNTFSKTNPTETESDILDSYSRRSLLVLDDLGAEKNSDWSRTAIFTIINRRYMNLLPTIITSNKSLDEIGSEIDDRLSSRFLEMGVVMNLTGKDHRLESFEK